jgi:hypothetical protein
MGRGKSMSVGPWGSFCRQYVGRPEFWFELNLSAQNNKWPGVFTSRFIRECCTDTHGKIQSNRHEAIEYCLKRRNEIRRLEESLGANPNDAQPTTNKAVKSKTETQSAVSTAPRYQKGLNKIKRGSEDKRKREHKDNGIDEICELSLNNEWHGPTTLPGVRNALNKLMRWSAENHGIDSIKEIDSNLLKQYAILIRKTQPKSARKDLSYLSSIFQCGIEHGMLDGPNPCQGIPRLKRSERRKAAAKTVELNNTLTAQQLHQLDQVMIKDKQSDIYLLQRFTGARQQEIAGLRHCDFRVVSGHKCIVIEAHQERGMGMEGQTCGVKTPQSQRVVPLPSCLDPLWDRLHSRSQDPCFPKQNNERNYGENYRARYHNKARARGLPAGTHSLRETMIQTLISNGVREYTIRCIAGKTMPMSDYVHEDIPKMAEAIAKYAKISPLEVSTTNT